VLEPVPPPYDGRQRQSLRGNRPPRRHDSLAPTTGRVTAFTSSRPPVSGRAGATVKSPAASWGTQGKAMRSIVCEIYNFLLLSRGI